MTSNLKKYTLQFSSQSENISLIEPFVEQLKDHYYIKDDIYFNILVVLTEAVNNCILHGNQADPNKNVWVEADVVNSSKILFTVADEGIGFNPDQIPDPTSPDRLASPNGRGVFLIRELSDYVQYSNNGRQLDIHFNLR